MEDIEYYESKLNRAKTKWFRVKIGIIASSMLLIFLLSILIWRVIL